MLQFNALDVTILALALSVLAIHAMIIALDLAGARADIELSDTAHALVGLFVAVVMGRIINRGVNGK